MGLLTLGESLTLLPALRSLFPPPGFLFPSCLSGFVVVVVVWLVLANIHLLVHTMHVLLGPSYLTQNDIF